MSDITVVLESTFADKDGVRKQRFSDTEGLVAHREWNGKPGRGGAWTEGDAPSDWEFDWEGSIDLTKAQEAKYNGPIAGMPNSIMMRLTALLRNAEPEPEPTPPPPPAPVVSPMSTAVSVPQTVVVPAAPENRGPVIITNRGDYVNRRDMSHFVIPKVRGRSAMSMVETAIKHRFNILLKGESGLGKTMLGEYVAWKKGWTLWVSQGSASKPAEAFWGTTEIDGAGSMYVPNGVTQAILERKPFVWVHDEVNMYQPDITSDLHGLLSDARRATLDVAGGLVLEIDPEVPFLIIGTYNEGYVGTGEMNEAFLRRFQIKAEWVVDWDVAAAMIPDPVVLECYKDLHSSWKSKGGGLKQFPTLTSFSEFVTLAEDMGVEWATGNLVENFRSQEDQNTVTTTINSYKDRIEASLAGEDASVSVAQKAQTDSDHDADSDSVEDKFPGV